MRYEQKYVVTKHQVGHIKEVLDHALVPDRRFGMDTVSSLYFDVPSLRSYNEVLNGDIVKEKLRLRWYESTEKAYRADEDVKTYLEVKSKEGFRGNKERFEVRLPWEVLNDPFERTDALWGFLQEAMGGLGWALRERVEPIIVIKYTRERYWDAVTGLRLSLDHTLRLTKTSPKLISRTLPFHSEMAVMEIKGNVDEWPDSLRGLIPFGLRRQSFSKYATMLHSYMEGPDE